MNSENSLESSGDWFLCDDGTRLLLHRWAARGGGRPGAVLHIVHGMSEHSLRYEGLARRLCSEGIEVWAADMRGHGKTADLKVNDPGRGGLGGHCVDEDSGGRVTRDVDQINRRIRQERPGVPLFLLGHSWGSFISQNYIENYRGIDGIILSGSRGPDGLRVQIAPPVMRLLAGIRGCRKGSSIARAFADGPFNRPFRPNRTSFDWISRDEEEVDKYISDPLCGFLCSSGFYRDLAVLLSRIHRPELMEKIDRDMPVYIFSGSADPVGDMGNSPTALVNAYRSLGVKDLEFVLYPDARHETLNETNREEVAGNLLAWLLRHSGGQS